MRVAVVLLLLLAACEESRGGFGTAPPPTTSPAAPAEPPTGSSSEPAERLRVVAPGGLRFSPTELVAPSDKVVAIELANEDDEEHTLVISELAVAMLAGPGQTVRTEIAIDRGNRGEFVFYCSIAGHREGGMEGTLRVAGT